MNCPNCFEALDIWRDKNVTHYYCPNCQPGYTGPPSKVLDALSILVVMAAVILYPLLVLYLWLKGESW